MLKRASVAEVIMIEAGVASPAARSENTKTSPRAETPVFEPLETGTSPHYFGLKLKG